MIDSFHGKYYFLSNFFDWSFTDKEGYFWPTSEHYFAAHKSKSQQGKDWIRQANNPATAKKRGRGIPIREDWEEIKFDVMWDALNYKFGTENDNLKKMLLDTLPHELIEGNYWGDTCWGVCNGVGENHLGKMLMRLRDELK